MGISSFPAQVGFDPSDYQQLNTYYSELDNYTSATPIDITGTQGFIESLNINCSVNTTLANCGVKITVDGKVYVDISLSTTLSTLGLILGASSKISGSDSLAGYAKNSSSSWALQNQFVSTYEPITLSESNQSFSNANKLFNIAGQIIRFNDSFKIELSRGASSSLPSDIVKLTYFTKYI